jgi:histidine triad (HIT) family protein
VAGEVPADVVASTPGTVAFRDIHPQAPTHVLVIPREHIDHAGTVTAAHGDLLAEMLTTAQGVARDEGVDERGYRLVLNVGGEAGNIVNHLHLHLLGGRRMAWPPG